MKKTIAILTSLMMFLSACAGPTGAAGTQGAQSGATGATQAAAESAAAQESAADESAAAEEPGGSEKPELVIMGQETSNYSRAAENKKRMDIDEKASALYAARELPKLSDKDYTVMVYVVGSNLESHYGAATNDINEMIASGLDYSKNNLLVYTGGSKRWTSDISNKCNSVINMANGEELQVEAQTAETADMGAAQTLSEFVNYCTTNFPAKHYGLVLWDHGAGPLWGYGSDELYDNDSLLFEELRGAMDKTIFTNGRKLDWVGFDACLMGSIETANLWKDYAQYLVGSEELESGRGWDYSFLSTLNSTDDARTIVSSIVDSYGSYYEANKSEFFNPDVTLAAMDLSKTDELIESAGVLFGAMKKGIEGGNYPEINKARARTKAFGLSAASSKNDAYDMLDLRDLAGNLEEMYPQECQAVHEALDGMLVEYTSNVSGASGMSIYLPGDNQELYGISKELYSEESALSESYTQFVNAYMDSWNESTNTDWTIAPIERSGEELTVQLTEEQVRNSSSAFYTVLQRNGFGDFAITTANVVIEPDENNVLHIPSDPMLLHAATDMEEAPVPLTCVQAQRNGEECIYKTISCYLTPGHEFMDVDRDKDEEVVITARNITGEREASVLDITSGSGSAWTGGKASVDVSNYETLINAGSIAYSPQRDSEGHMLPYFEWKSTGYEMFPLCLEQGFRIQMKPASEFDRDFICQVLVKDINGNVHGSDYIELNLDHSRNYEQIPTEKGTLYADVSGEEAVITGYSGEDEELTIPAEVGGKKVTEIGRYALSVNTLQKIVLPDGLKTIGIEALSGTAITELEIPDSVEEIQRGAFSDVENITSVRLPESLVKIGSVPFNGCDNLAEITISDKNTNYKTVDGVLYSGDGKTLIQYPCAKGGEYKVEKGTEVIGYGAFAESAIEKVVFPDTIKTFENMTFFECDKLSSFNLPDSVESIGIRAFGFYDLFTHSTENPVIDKVRIGPNVKYIGTDAFNMMNIAAFEVDESNPYFASSGGFITNKAKDTIIELPRGMKPIMVIPEGITALEDHSLENCSEVTDFVIPDSVFRFGTEVFPYDLEDDGNGGYILLYDGITLHCSGGSAAEKYAEQFEIEHDDVTDPDYMVYETVTEEMPGADGADPITMTFHVFKDRAELWECETYNKGVLTIPETFRDLPVTGLRSDEYSFSSCSSRKLIIPASVEKIDVAFLNTFSGCEAYEIDEKNENYRSIDGVIFDASGETLIGYPGGKKDKEYEVPAKTERIGNSAVYFNSNLGKVTFPKSLRTIGDHAFNGCYGLTTVVFNKGLKEIGKYAFNGAPLADVSLPSSVVSIGDLAFTLTETFGRIELPEKVETMGYAAFDTGYGDYVFTQDVIRIPSKLKFNKNSISGAVFDQYEVDEDNENFTVTDGLLMSKDGSTLAAVPTGMEGDLYVPEGTFYIQFDALEECDRIKDIYLPASILDIGSIDEKDYDTGEYKYVIHCYEGTEAQKSLDAEGTPWKAR